jgi:ABC-type molybdate transport system substrate-binding protein
VKITSLSQPCGDFEQGQPLGIVYATDAKVSPGVKIIGTFPADAHPAIIYPVAAIVTAKPKAVGSSYIYAQ